MSLEDDYYGTLFNDPMVEEAVGFGFDLGRHRILSKCVLKHYYDLAERFMPEGSLARNHFEWIKEIFPEIFTVGRISNPWAWSELIAEADNVGSVEETRKKVLDWFEKGHEVAYWTGGLQFTRNQYNVAEILLNKGFNLVLGVEPWVYAAKKKRASLSDDIIPISLWSLFLKDRGVIFSVPRPLPETDELINSFYEDLYLQITLGKAHIVVDVGDQYRTQKVKRGQIVGVPHFVCPTTTQICEDYALTSRTS